MTTIPRSPRLLKGDSVPTRSIGLLSSLAGASVLQRKCACGQHAAGGECQACRRKKRRLQRSRGAFPEPNGVPPIVDEVLRSPGEPLDASVRAFMEPRLGHDFSGVRLHSGPRAAESAQAVGALAYTVGRHVVFGAGQLRPETESGQRLLAHELVHVLQQEGSSAAVPGPAGASLEIAPTNDALEREADSLASSAVDAPTPLDAEPVRALRGGSVSSEVSPGYLRRALKVDRPAEPVPTPSPSGRTPTNAEAVEGYLRTLSSQGNVAVDRGSGRVRMDEAFCRTRGQRFLHEFGRGAATGARIGAYFLGVGALPGLIIGGLVGLISGIASAASGPESGAAASSTPTGATCLCDFVTGGNLWTIEVNDEEHPHAGGPEQRVVRVPSPNSPRIWGAATVSGRLQNLEPWLVLGHELCGHAWITEHEDDEEGAVIGEDRRHHRTVERENLLRREHGLEARGFRLRDPYCGESFFRQRSNPTGPPQFDYLLPEDQRRRFRSTVGSDYVDRTYLDDCQAFRETYLGDIARRYRVDQRIPEEEPRPSP